MEKSEVRKSIEDYERDRALKGVDKLNWDVCLYYIKYDDTYDVGIMYGTSGEVAEKLCEHWGRIYDIRVIEVKLSELIKGLYEQMKESGNGS